ncbi:MAG: NUDIX pyrophosphatase [Ignavibacteriaceae bacterium]
MEIISKMIEVHIFRETGDGIEFLLLKRSEKVIYPGLWQMVNGKIKNVEKAYQTALREIREETGIVPEKLWVVPKVNSFYSHENDNIMLLPVFAAQFNFFSKVVISSEHSEFKWVNPEEAKKLLAWDGQRQSVDLILNYFKKEINFLNLIEIKF